MERQASAEVGALLLMFLCLGNQALDPHLHGGYHPEILWVERFSFGPQLDFLIIGELQTEQIKNFSNSISEILPLSSMIQHPQLFHPQSFLPNLVSVKAKLGG